MEQGCAYGDNGEYLQRKYDFFDVADIADNQAWCSAYTFRKKIENHHLEKQTIVDFKKIVVQQGNAQKEKIRLLFSE